jgi:cysteine/glycine-rich protein
MDKIELNNKIFHKNCFKCNRCKKTLDLTTFRKTGDTLFCVKHYNDELNTNIITNVVFSEAITKVEKIEKNEEGDDTIYKEEKVDLSKKNKVEYVKPSNKSDKPTQIVAKNPKCYSCDNPVLFNERLELGEKIFHKDCFKCTVCSKKVDLSNFRKIKDVLYCQKHYNDYLNPNIKTNAVYQGK